ncbi:MAG: ABC transporter ATP-binding protein [Geminicoccaceae bacterium]
MIDVKGLVKRYGDKTVLDGIDLSVAEGECLALLGHNGAGKTTFMKVVLGLVRADSGWVDILGGAAGRREARTGIGYLPENIAFHPLLTGRETLETCCRLKGRAAGEAGGLLERVELGEAADRPVSTYSKGMRQRLGLAQALIGEPRLLVLDEPTSGLDPMLRRRFFSIVEEFKGRGVAILLSSHQLTELEARTDRTAILRQGRLVAEGALSDLRRQAALPIRVRLRSESIDSIHDRLGGRRINGQSLELTCAHEDRIGFLRRLTELPVDIDDLEWGMPGLDDLYAHFDEQGGQRP